MSKIIESLQKVNEARSDKYTTAVGKGSSVGYAAIIANGEAKASHARAGYGSSAKRRAFAFETIALICVMVIGSVAIMLSYMTLREVRTNKSSTGLLLGQLSEQQKRINAVKDEMVSGMGRIDVSMQSLTADSKSLTKNLEKNQSQIEDMSKLTKQLQSEINDLKWANKSMTDKYIDLNDKVMKLTNVKVQ